MIIICIINEYIIYKIGRYNKRDLATVIFILCGMCFYLNVRILKDETTLPSAFIKCCNYIGTRTIPSNINTIIFKYIYILNILYSYRLTKQF